MKNKANLLCDRSSGGLVSLSTERKAQCLPVVYDNYDKRGTALHILVLNLKCKVCHNESGDL